MGSEREKGRDEQKSRKLEIEKKRKEIADLQRRLKETIERRNGKIRKLEPFEIKKPGDLQSPGWRNFSAISFA
jgi:hypothetical protein